MTLNEILAAERTATRALNAIHPFADAATRTELTNALYILAEARHFAVCVNDAQGHPEAADYLNDARDGLVGALRPEL